MNAAVATIYVNVYPEMDKYMLKNLRNIYSLSKVLSVCTSLHSPSPKADTALTLTSYSVPASSVIRVIEIAGGEPVMVT